MALAQLDNTLTLSLTVTDRQKTAAWYEKMMGFKVVFQIDEPGWTELSTNVPGVTLGLGEGDEATQGSTMPVFGTTDLHAARAAMEAEGVEFTGETEDVPGMVRLAQFLDPDGNKIMLAQNLSEGDG